MYCIVILTKPASVALRVIPNAQVRGPTTPHLHSISDTTAAPLPPMMVFMTARATIAPSPVCDMCPREPPLNPRNPVISSSPPIPASCQHQRYKTSSSVGFVRLGFLQEVSHRWHKVMVWKLVRKRGLFIDICNFGRTLKWWWDVFLILHPFACYWFIGWYTRRYICTKYL